MDPITQEPMSNLDYVLLRADEPDNHMIITGLMLLEQPLSIDQLKQTAKESLLKQARFHQRLVIPEESLTMPYWEDDPYFDLENHIQSISLEAYEDPTKLQDFISDLMGTDLDLSCPLWKFYLIENYEGGSAVVARLHHCMADGIALMKVLMSLTSSTAEFSNIDTDEIQNGFSRTIHPTQFVKSKRVQRNSERVFLQGLGLLADREFAKQSFKEGGDIASSLGRIVLRFSESATVLKGALGKEKKAVWSEPIPLEDLDQIRLAYGPTVNDTILTAISGAIRRYLISKDESPEGKTIHSFIPVNLRTPNQMDQMGNKVSALFLALPIDVSDPIDRLLVTRQRTEELKGSKDPLVTYGAFNYLVAVPKNLQDLIIGYFDTRFSTIITNVPGPREQRYLAGVPLKSMIAWVPQIGRVSFGVSILSYLGNIVVGIAADKGLIPDPENILLYLAEEVEILKSSAEQQLAKRRESIAPLFSQLDELEKTLDSLLNSS